MGNLELNLDPPPPTGGVVELRGGGRGLGVFVLIVGLLIVVILAVAVGRSRDKSNKNIAAPTSTTSLATTTTTSDASSTSTSQATTTTIANPVQVLGPLLPDKTGTTLVLVQGTGHIVQVDVDSGTVTDLLPGQRLRNTYQLVVLRHGVVVSGDNGSQLIADGQSSTVRGNADSFIGTPDGIHIVGFSYNENGPQLVSLIPGGPLDPSIPLPQQSDALALLPGALVLQGHAGGVYSFDLSSGAIHKIADGAFVAAAGDRVVSYTCDGTMKCQIGVGPFGVRPAHLVDIVAGLTIGSSYYGASLSPSRDLLAFAGAAASGSTTVVVLDLDTGAVLLRAAWSSGSSPFVWSPDGRWLFWVDDGMIRAWSPERGGDPLNFANARIGAANLIAAGYPG